MRDDLLDEELSRGFQRRVVAQRQHETFLPLLSDLREGRPRADFKTLAEAVSLTHLTSPLVMEVGCGSGWNSEVLFRLLHRPCLYIGTDYSEWMIRIARETYPGVPFLVADATGLPFRNNACDVVVSGTVLMHILDYRRAIRESVRVATGWCIFHTVPVVQRRETAVLKKLAYGEPVIEIIFNEEEFRGILEVEGARVAHVLDSIPYDLHHILGEPSVTKTYVCEVGG